MDLKNKYQNIIEKMNKIDYGKLWPNFRQYNIALYDSDNVCYKGRIFQKTSEFIANTSINYDNEMIGIWNLQEDIDDDILTSKLIHETFHAFQVENNESRYPNELDALLKYRYNSQNLSLKMRENYLIVELLESFNKEAFSELINIRLMRLKLFPYEVLYEMSVEQIEGTANFVELEALKQLNYNKYMYKLNRMKKSILNINNLLPIRIISYDVGALIIKILVENKLTMNYDFNEKNYLDFFLKTYNYIDIEFEELSEVKKIIDKFYLDTKNYINKSIKKENLIIQGEFELLGVNIYNARFYNNYIITEYFLMYKDESNQKVLNGDFVIKINEKLYILEVYKLIR